MTAECKHKRREFWDCGCGKADNDACEPHAFNSRCARCGTLLVDRPNLIDGEPIRRLRKLKTACGVCNEQQVDSPSGPTCPNGHAGALGVPLPKVATIRARPLDEISLTDSTCTPKWLADLLFEMHGPFDLDPCSNPRSHIISRWAFSLERKLDGLRLPWRGSVFKNNPFSDPLPWQIKAQEEMRLGRCTELVELCKLDPSTLWWETLTAPIARGYDVVEARLGHVTISGRVGGPTKIGVATMTQRWFTPDIWLFKNRVQYEEHPDIIAQRAREFAEAEAAGKKPKGHRSGKSSNNFCSAIVHWRFDAPPLRLESVATRWVRA